MFIHSTQTQFQKLKNANSSEDTKLLLLDPLQTLGHKSVLTLHLFRGGSFDNQTINVSIYLNQQTIIQNAPNPRICKICKFAWTQYFLIKMLSGAVDISISIPGYLQYLLQSMSGL